MANGWEGVEEMDSGLNGTRRERLHSPSYIQKTIYGFIYIHTRTYWILINGSCCHNYRPCVYKYIRFNLILIWNNYAAKGILIGGASLLRVREPVEWIRAFIMIADYLVCQYMVYGHAPVVFPILRAKGCLHFTPICMRMCYCVLELI